MAVPMLTVLVALVAAVTGLVRLAKLSAKARREEARLVYSTRKGRLVKPIIGLFHPYCDAGGGGERVLWTVVRALQRECANAAIVIYSGDVSVSKDEILRRAKTRFDISVNGDALDIVYLQKRALVEDSRYPRLTLLGQSLGSIFLGFEALSGVTPDIFLDTMGYAFTYPLAKLYGCRVGAYVHYPTISADMLRKVQSGVASVNNSEEIATSRVFNGAKLLYYRIFAVIYGFVGSFADEVMVNSSWTKDHIDEIWKKNAAVVYPPCGTAAFRDMPIDGREQTIVSVAQFRPEKDHALQLKALAECLQLRPKWRSAGSQGIKLQLIGGVRDAQDRARVESLQKLAADMGIQDRVEFIIDASFEELQRKLSRALVGIHTMWNEHFGIGVVEYMAAGVIPVVHDSGGPKMDIVVNGVEKVGYVAATSADYANALVEIFEMRVDQRHAIQGAARRRAIRTFSEEAFEERCMSHLKRLIAMVH